MKFTRILLLAVTAIYCVSCSTQKRVPYYLENVVDTSGKEEVKVPELRFQKNDLLSIQVYSKSTLPEVSDAIYNLPSGSATGGATGFLIDAFGNIEYPRLGAIHAEGLTKQELASEIKKRLTQPVELLKDPTVIIRFLNFRVTMLGEVARIGSVTVPGERLTILEAIGVAGGITDYGKKNTVKVIRETNGKREIGYIDLSSKDLFNSPYYNLVQNDVILVEPTKQRAKQAEQSLVAQRITFALSLITSAAFIYNIFK
ncbi:MAG: polysaccharide biosynthesis/export family protein [Sphingobacteriales bacterium]|nr:polysaccharide biosynthesis/export family protein [Sphingobacteriales bacterium]